MSTPTSTLVRLAFVVLLLQACDAADTPQDATTAPETAPVQVFEGQAVQSVDSVLAFRVRFRTDVPARGRVYVTEDDAAAPRVIEGDGEPATDHEVHVLGLAPSTSYRFVPAAGDGAGEGRGEPLEVRTDPLPDDFPEFAVTAAPDGDVDAWTLVVPMRWLDSPDRFWGTLLALDGRGRVGWYLRAPLVITAATPLADGNLLYVSTQLGLVEVDRRGRVVSEVSAADLGVDGVHHDVIELPDGRRAVLGIEMKSVDGYPADAVGNTVRNVVGDVVVEYDADGRVAARWSMFDLLDPHRTRPGFDEPFYTWRYSDAADPKDWTHGNSLVYDPGDDTLLVSLRHQDWILKIDRRTGALVWRLGPEGDFALQSGRWFTHQHAPQLLPGGRILVYDNGTGEAVAPVGDGPRSRVVEYRLDEAARTATQVWEFAGDAPYFSPVFGAARELADGHVLVTDGAIVPASPGGVATARIVERGPRCSTEPFLQVDVRDPAGKVGFTVYRAERLPAGWLP